jgi:hypothetical protein
MARQATPAVESANHRDRFNQGITGANLQLVSVIGITRLSYFDPRRGEPIHRRPNRRTKSRPGRAKRLPVWRRILRVGTAGCSLIVQPTQDGALNGGPGAASASSAGAIMTLR